MSLIITASHAAALNNDVWTFEMLPRQLKLFGEAPQAVGAKSIILIRDGRFDPEAATLQFDAEDAVPLNIGSQPTTIAIGWSTQTAQQGLRVEVPIGGSEVGHGAGDREFLNMVRRLMPEPLQAAAVSLLNEIRRRSAGDLKRGKSRNFSNTPDNFWYVIVQPRVAELSVTVRGSVDHFAGMAKLPIKDDRGNTLFKIAGPRDVPAALDLIFHAKRKLPI